MTKKIPSKLEVAPYALKMLTGMEWVIPLRLLRLLEHLRCQKVAPFNTFLEIEGGSDIVRGDVEGGE